jgi:NAD+ synthase (glutamine-hydrolysing)
LVAVGPRFSFKEYVVTTAAVPVNSAHSRKEKRRKITARGKHLPQLVAVKGVRLPRVETLNPLYRVEGWEASRALKHEEFTRAVTLGLFDYLRKSKSHGFVVSLSGGVDSSAISCLVALMVQSSISELGLSECKARLSHIPWIKGAGTESEILKGLLACVYQATRNSTVTTRLSARRVAQQIGATFFALEIDSLVEEYKKIVASELGIRLSWETHDVALQNIQARVRSPSVWLIANLRRALLLATSNRSEASVGYTTMDGDSSGGLAPLAGIDKAYLREWLRWLQKTGPLGMRSFSSLALVNAQEPTAELRPRGASQTDEGDLMPYVVLDSIERKAVRDKCMPVEVYRHVCSEYKGRYSKKQLKHWVERFFTLWSTNQWKRERLAPSFHLDDESVDPKTWCRFPILSSGYSMELSELKKVP